MSGQPANYAGKVIFTCCLLRDKFCHKYFWNPEYFTGLLMNFLIIFSISVKQLNIMEVQHDRDALLNFVWKCLPCNLQQLQSLFVKTITGYLIIIIIIIIIINNLIAPFLEASKGALQLFTLVNTI